MKMKSLLVAVIWTLALAAPPRYFLGWDTVLL
jgi:hypothetical protein